VPRSGRHKQPAPVFSFFSWRRSAGFQKAGGTYLAKDTNFRTCGLIVYRAVYSGGASYRLQQICCWLPRLRFERRQRRCCLGTTPLQPVGNNYDWLGSGVYFWEHGPVRHLNLPSVNPGAFAARSASQPQSVLTSSWGIASTYWTRGTRPYSRSLSALCAFPLGSKNCQYPRMRNAGAMEPSFCTDETAR